MVQFAFYWSFPFHYWKRKTLYVTNKKLSKEGKVKFLFLLMSSEQFSDETANGCNLFPFLKREQEDGWRRIWYKTAYNLSLRDQYKHLIDYSQKAPKLERTFRIPNFLFVCCHANIISWMCQQSHCSTHSLHYMYTGS